jgi:hypothetical protein
LERTEHEEARRGGHGAQSSRCRIPRDIGAIDRVPALRLDYRPPDNLTIGTILKGNGYATSWFGKNHERRASRKAWQVRSINGRQE